MTILLALAAGGLVGLALMTVVPAPTIVLLLLGVGVPEWSPAFLAAALVTGGIAFGVTAGYARRTLVAVALAAAALFARPLLQLPSARAAADAAFIEAGVRLPWDTMARLSPPPFRWRTLVSRSVVDGVVVTRGVPVSAPEGEPLTADVYAPPGARGLPVIVQLYGGAWQRGEPGDDAGFAATLASHGYVVCGLDYRHAPRWTWPAQRHDVAAALAWVRASARRFGGDPSRLVVIGRSAGGQLALDAALRAAPGTVTAVVAFYAPVDLARGWREPPEPDPIDSRAVLEAYLGGTPDSHADAYRDASPLTHVSSHAPPSLLLYGERDHVVEAQYGRALHERLREAGATSVLLELPWSEHAFDEVPRGIGEQFAWHYVERFVAWAVTASRSPR